MAYSRARRSALIVFSAFSLLTASWAFGQTNQEVNGGIQFNFSNPGARSLALGGAFVGLADDATAAFSNPAGLTNLSKPEISLEGRHWTYRNQYFCGCGATSFQRADTDVNGLAFASFVFPKKNWALAVYRDEQAHFQTKANVLTAGALPGTTFVYLPFDGTADLRITNYGGSVAFRLGEAFSLGATVVASQYKQRAADTRFNIKNDLTRGDPAGGDARRFTDSVDASQTKVTYSAGLLWKPSRVISIGAIYRHGPRFDLTATLTPINPSGTPATVSAVFRVPDVFGAGISVKPTDFLTASVEYDRVRYSQFTRTFTDLFEPTLGTAFQSKDADEIHFGLQYAIPLGSSVLALRAGFFRDPAHGVRFTGTANSGDSEALAAYKTLESLAFYGGKTNTHYSGGIGLAVGEHVQFDAAYDSASSVRTGSASLVVRF